MLLKRKSSAHVKGKNDYGRDARLRPGHQPGHPMGWKSGKSAPHSDWRPGLTIAIKTAPVSEPEPTKVPKLKFE